MPASGETAAQGGLAAPHLRRCFRQRRREEEAEEEEEEAEEEEEEEGEDEEEAEEEEEAAVAAAAQRFAPGGRENPAQPSGRLSENTRLATRYAVKIFRDYLSEKEQPAEFERLGKEELCRALRSFYAEARSKSGQVYSKSSLISIRSSLNRYLNEPPYSRTLDLTKDPELRSANLTLAAVIRKLEEQGAGPVIQKQAITR
ncbi:cell division control protein 45 homolog [Carcharodon carcharias]|uniref:cell division control protein 45 homolog n=1 Tax=Carcharodon carcharias TaxID=13397 RepID=UPI001B7E534E|nr:cell division control protein 45 homolog [Carcharodon carcharias]